MCFHFSFAFSSSNNHKITLLFVPMNIGDHEFSYWPPFNLVKLVLNMGTVCIYACFLLNANHLPKAIQNCYFWDYYFIVQRTLLFVLEIELTFKIYIINLKNVPYLQNYVFPTQSLSDPFIPSTSTLWFLHVPFHPWVFPGADCHLTQCSGACCFFFRGGIGKDFVHS